MFGISMWEMALIILVGLIFLGPRQLTETARAVGKLFREIQRMAVDVKDSIDLDAPPRKPPTYDPTHTPLPKPAAQSNDREPLGMPGEKSGPDLSDFALFQRTKAKSLLSGFSGVLCPRRAVLYGFFLL